MLLKVSIGARIKDGPWGGGNLFVINLVNYLRDLGHEVKFDLDDPDIDIILLTDPRKKSESSSFNHKDIKKYLKKINPRSRVVHRINECDERKNTKGLNKFYIKANKIADHTIFVSTWLQDLYIDSGFDNKNFSVIMSGSDKKIFFPKVDKHSEKLKIVTHHWGGNWNKGFEIYKKLDEMLYTSELKNKVSFTYIGNLPKKFNFENSVYIPPLSGMELANELRKYDIYLTGSLNEPSGNHHIEGAQCGLPLLYIESGALPEYCDGYGVSFNNLNFEIKLNEIIENYDLYLKKIKDYPNNSDLMCKEYLNVFEKVLN